MKLRFVALGLLLTVSLLPAFSADDYRPGPDSLPQPGVPKGTVAKDSYTAAGTSVFPGTIRDYQVYLPAGFDASKPAPFMVFQDGVIYQAPVVFDNLVAKKEIPPLVGIFVKPGVVPAANENALPRFNRSYEYDTVNGNYARFLVDELLPAIEKKQGIRLSTDPNEAAIAGSSSGGICAWQVAWERPDRFRRVFTSVGTYVEIHGGDQIPVLVRKVEPKPIRVFLQSGTGDNNLYCGDWWMANQTMERALTWAGYDVNHAWGDGGHNQKHATAIFPDVLRWLWRDWQTNKEIKANPRGESKWKGYEVVGEGEWTAIPMPLADGKTRFETRRLCSALDGTVFVLGDSQKDVWSLSKEGMWTSLPIYLLAARRRFAIEIDSSGRIATLSDGAEGSHHLRCWTRKGELIEPQISGNPFYSLGDGLNAFTLLHSGAIVGAMKPEYDLDGSLVSGIRLIKEGMEPYSFPSLFLRGHAIEDLCVAPDQTTVYASCHRNTSISACTLEKKTVTVDPFAAQPTAVCEVPLHAQPFGLLEHRVGEPAQPSGMCVDTNGWLYVATDLGVQVLDPCGRVNFILPTPKQPHDVCFGGPDLTELFIACGDAIYKRKTKAHGYLSGQMAPIKPASPKL